MFVSGAAAAVASAISDCVRPEPLPDQLASLFQLSVGELRRGGGIDTESGLHAVEIQIPGLLLHAELGSDRGAVGCGEVRGHLGDGGEQVQVRPRGLVDHRDVDRRRAAENKGREPMTDRPRLPPGQGLIRRPENWPVLGATAIGAAIARGIAAQPGHAVVLACRQLVDPCLHAGLFAAQAGQSRRGRP